MVFAKRLEKKLLARVWVPDSGAWVPAHNFQNVFEKDMFFEHNLKISGMMFSKNRPYAGLSQFHDIVGDTSY